MGVAVAVGVFVGVAVGVFVGVAVGVLVGVRVVVLVGVEEGVAVWVGVAVMVGVAVGVAVSVAVAAAVSVAVGAAVVVIVAVASSVAVGVEAGRVGVPGGSGLERASRTAGRKTADSSWSTATIRRLLPRESSNMLNRTNIHLRDGICICEFPPLRRPSPGRAPVLGCATLPDVLSCRGFGLLGRSIHGDWAGAIMDQKAAEHRPFAFNPWVQGYESIR